MIRQVKSEIQPYTHRHVERCADRHMDMDSQMDIETIGQIPGACRFSGLCHLGIAVWLPLLPVFETATALCSDPKRILDNFGHFETRLQTGSIDYYVALHCLQSHSTNF